MAAGSWRSLLSRVPSVTLRLVKDDCLLGLLLLGCCALITHQVLLDCAHQAYKWEPGGTLTGDFTVSESYKITFL